MNTSLIVIEFTVLILAIFVGFEVISKVPTMLHTPLMSGTNAIHGIVLVGAIVVAGLPHQATWIRIVALAAVALGTMNVVGGFVVTDRMLGMFKHRREAPVRERGRVDGVPGQPGGSAAARQGADEQV
jgi:H+-translocating NAD(P) transhydrogenase subunit alpha